MNEENLSHEEVFGHLTDNKTMTSVDVWLYLDDDLLFDDFLSYKLKGKLMKMFPPTTLGEVRRWKKESK